MLYQDFPMGNPYLGGMPYQQAPGLGEMCQPQIPCIPCENVITNVRLARAYVPFQKLCTLYAPNEALDKGTAFPELYSPYMKSKDLRMEPVIEESGDDNE